MWLCQMVYAKVILGIQIDWSIVPRTSANLRAMHWSPVIPESMLGYNIGQPTPLAWQSPKNPLAFQAGFDLLLVPSHQPLGTSPSK